MKRYKIILPVLLAVITIVISGCNRPSNKDIERAVYESLKQRVPASLAKNLIGGQDAAIDEIRVVKIGTVQGEGSNKYWPVKVYVKGSCVVLFGNRQHFEGETEYYLKKDPYGTWVANCSKF